MTRHFFDCGANIGQTFDWYLTKHPEYDGWNIVCFEPSPRNWPELMAKAKSLKDIYRITLCTFGLAGLAGTPLLHEKAASIGDSFIDGILDNGGRDVPDIATGYDLHAATVRLSDFIRDNTEPGDEIVVKLDCEGCEFGILEEMLEHPWALANCSHIMVEWHVLDKNDWTSERDRIMSLYAAAGHPIERWDF